MVKRWLLYLVSLLGTIVFFAAYQGWVAWLLLVMTACLPLLSLLLSLAPMLSVKPAVCCPRAVTRGEHSQLTVTLSSRLPLPPFRCHFQIVHSLTGEKIRLNPNDPLPTRHCGRLVCRSSGLFVYDFLGLFRFRLRMAEQQILIRPVELPMEPPRELERHLAHSWQPKHGGGFAENHELRLYRPGDNLNQVHWKLSAKTGKLMIREPMVPRYGRILLTMDLSGTPFQLDRKLGQLLWMGRYLLDLGLRYELHVLTGSGVQVFCIAAGSNLTESVDRLLCCAPALEGTIRNHRDIASWQFHIGGDPDES